MKNSFVSALILLSSALSFAGQAGYIMNGKTYIVYKDGEKVGEYPELPAPQKGRKPDAIGKGVFPIQVRFEEDELARCYTTAYTNGRTDPDNRLFCIKK